MKTIEKEEQFAYFKKGVTSTIPFMEVVLEFVYLLIKSFKLKEVTQRIREGKADKTKDLPSVTFSGTFFKRCVAGLKDYSSLIIIDVDKLDYAATLKDRISKDTFLNVVLQFISPRSFGLKIVVRVKDGVMDNHKKYFEAISLYLKGAYGIVVDASGSEISRLCFLCHDEEVYYNPDGFVTSEALLRLLPKPEKKDFTNLEKKDFTNLDELTRSGSGRRTLAAERILPSSGSSTVTGEKPSDRLNKMSEIHNMAVRALQRNGWQQNRDEELWTRPNKEVRKGCSAIYNLHPVEGIWFLTCFTSSDPLFKCHKGYTDVQIICLLDFNDDWTSCIAELASRYLEPV